VPPFTKVTTCNPDEDEEEGTTRTKELKMGDNSVGRIWIATTEDTNTIGECVNEK
jgi:hypothetical protein